MPAITKFIAAGFAGLVLAFAAAFPAAAADDGRANPFTIDELRFGGYLHDHGRHEPGGVSLQGEILFTELDLWSDRFDNVFWRILTTPRPHVGGYVNTEGKTNYAYLGLTWRANLGPVLFVEGTFGGAVHDGEIGTLVDGIAVVPGKPDRGALGTRVIFRESISVGLQLTEQWSVLATAQHLSNGDIGTQVNNGLTNYGVKVGFKF